MRAETAGFDRASHEYERGRPGYPADAVDYVSSETNAGEGEIVVDLGAGTGKLTAQLVARGLDVVAVEPLDEMRARLSEQLPEVTALAGTAYDTGLASARAAAVTVAQAFHWFAGERALTEIARILRPRGRLILLWNRRDLENPVQASISRLISPYAKGAPSYASGEWRRVMAATSLFRPVGERCFSLVQTVDRSQLVDRVGSTSYIGCLEDSVRLPLLEKVGALVPDGRTVDLPHDTEVYVFELIG
jgi:SAM-dependent methyltransferase